MVSAKHDKAAAELITLRAEVHNLLNRNAMLRGTVERLVQVLETCDSVGAPHPTHDAVIVGLAKVCGSGEMMKAILHEWRGHLRLIHDWTSPSANHFTVGPTRDALEGALRVGRAALGAKR